MGFTPREIDTMTLWEFIACCDGLNASRGGEDGDRAAPMSAERMEELGLM